MTKAPVIFFGNGPLADYTLAVLEPHFDIIFHAKTKADLETVKTLKKEREEAHGILASFGVMIKSDVLDLFEPEGILNIHPSLLPKYRGPSPIETAILNGDDQFSVSIMKLAKAMDAGPVYASFTLDSAKIDSCQVPPNKSEIYRILATTGATWLVKNLDNLPTPKPQSGEPTFTKMLDKSMSPLDPTKKSATELLCQIRAFAGFPKSKYEFYGQDCTVLSAHVAAPKETPSGKTLFIQCHDNSVLIIDTLQPAGRKPMDARSFLNGYAK